MLLDHLDNAFIYSGLGERIMTGLFLLHSETLRTAPIGKHEVHGADLFYMVDEYSTKPFDQGRPEIHHKYLDIQYIVSGTECIGFMPLDRLAIDQPYDAQKDIAFCKYAPGMSRLILTPGMFAIFWPSEPHMPCRSLDMPQTVRKIVIKVCME